jgi:hypothetical protein
MLLLWSSVNRGLCVVDICSFLGVSPPLLVPLVLNCAVAGAPTVLYGSFHGIVGVSVVDRDPGVDGGLAVHSFFLTTVSVVKVYS